MQQTGKKGVQGKERKGGKDDPLVTVQEIKIWQYKQMSFA